MIDRNIIGCHVIVMPQFYKALNVSERSYLTLSCVGTIVDIDITIVRDSFSDQGTSYESMVVEFFADTIHTDDWLIDAKLIMLTDDPVGKWKATYYD